MKKQSDKFQIIAIENQRNELVTLLKSDASLIYKRIGFFNFFRNICEQKNQASFRSYYIEFEIWVPRLSDGLMALGWSPDKLENFIRIIRNFKLFASTNQIEIVLEEAELKSTKAAMMACLYVGELDRAAKLIGFEFPDCSDTPFTSLSELEKAQEFLRDRPEISAGILPEIVSRVDNWAKSFHSFSSQSIQVLLIDEFNNSQLLDSQGIIFSLTGAVRERPYDVEVDQVVLNNAVHFGEGSFRWALLDGVAAARQLFKQSGSLAGRHYSYQFSLPDKAAILSGNSIGVAAGILGYVLVLNRYYRAPIAGISKASALTGSIQSNGKILSVDSHGLKAKLQSAFFSPLKRVFVPSENFAEAVLQIDALKKQYPNRNLILEGVDTLSQAIQDCNLIRKTNISLRRRTVGAIKRITQKNYALIVLGCMVIFFMVIFGLAGRNKYGPPANYQIQGSELRVFDANQQFLWSHDLGIKLTPAKYSKNVIIQDIDHDGQIDVLWGTYENSDAQVSGQLWRLGADGSVIWKRHVGRKVHFGGEIFDDHFRIENICVQDLDQDGLNEIIIVAHHFPFYPECVQICDVNNRLISEYWHVGQTNVIDFIDLDQDGIMEIILGGQNNEYGNAILSIIDFRTIQGCSPQTPGRDYFPDSLAFGTEKYYIRFPRTVFERFGTRDTILSFQKKRRGFTTVITNDHPQCYWSFPEKYGMIYYDFDNQMNLIREPAFGDSYNTILASRFNIRIQDIDLSHYQKVLYWNGNEWTPKASVNSRWKESGRK